MIETPRVTRRTPIAAEESSAMRAIPIEFDSAGLESFSDESPRRVVSEALTSLLHKKPVQSAMRITRESVQESVEHHLVGPKRRQRP